MLQELWQMDKECIGWLCKYRHFVRTVYGMYEMGILSVYLDLTVDNLNQWNSWSIPVQVHTGVLNFFALYFSHTSHVWRLYGFHLAI